MCFQKFARLAGAFSYCVFETVIVSLIALHSERCKEPEITLLCADNNQN